ncbi:DUF1778 domain-containing protein [Marinicella rhabdoformis]|uniref:type II toxin -antitoxin system TacA 1-like antitoxin n=1 Tax=Marinicella rhabdoformis TaxID=2580566 RepID=UPI0012AED65D|nr:DUF1778 domain-containing protein [Marinicella rhabdoformis]
MRLSIEITPEQHQLLKVAAALQGETIKSYVLKRALPDVDENEALAHLESFLQPRVKAASKEKLSSKSVAEIFQKVLDGAK